jgi:hypothetical protein
MRQGPVQSVRQARALAACAPSLAARRGGGGGGRARRAARGAGLLLQGLPERGAYAFQLHGHQAGQLGELLPQTRALRAHARGLAPQARRARRQPALHLAVRQRAHVPAHAPGSCVGWGLIAGGLERSLAGASSRSGVGLAAGGDGRVAQQCRHMN